MPESKILPWHLYIIRTNRGQLYTGITQDVTRRFKEHQEGGKKAAKYLRGKGPLKLEFQQEVGSKSSALKIEFAIKKLPKQGKEKLTKNAEGWSLVELGLPSKLQEGN
jgi:putative endonuclease